MKRPGPVREGLLEQLPDPAFMPDLSTCSLSLERRPLGLIEMKMLNVCSVLNSQCVLFGNQAACSSEFKNAATTSVVPTQRELAVGGAAGFKRVSETQQPVHPFDTGSEECGFQFFSGRS